MDEDRGKKPLFPANYVTLAQLEERWAKEQQRKKSEKEEEERRRRESEERERKREDQENQKRLSENGDRSKARAVPRKPFGQSRRDQPEKSSAAGTSERTPEDLGIGVLVNDGGEGKIDDSSKKKKNKWKKKRKPRPEEDQRGGRENFTPEKEAEENVPVILSLVSEENRETKMNDCEIRRNVNNLPVNGKAREKNVWADRSNEIGRKFVNLALNSKGGSRGKSSGNMHGSHRMQNRSYGRLNRPILHNPRDSKLVWMRKGDTSDVDASSSGALSKGEEGYGKQVH